MDIKKLKKNMETSCTKIVNNNDYLKNKFGKDYSDTDNDSYDGDSDSDDGMSKYSKRNHNIIDKIGNNNSSIRMTNVKKKLNEKKKEMSKKNEHSDTESDSESDDSGSDDSDDESYEYEFQEEFTKCVVNYCKADDMINEYNEKIKELKKIKKECDPEILKHLERLGRNQIEISGGKLIRNEYIDKGKPKEELVKNMIKKNCEKNVSQKIFDEIDKEHAKNKKTRTSLKRTHEKKKK